MSTSLHLRPSMTALTTISWLVSCCTALSTSAAALTNCPFLFRLCHSTHCLVLFLTPPPEPCLLTTTLAVVSCASSLVLSSSVFTSTDWALDSTVTAGPVAADGRGGEGGVGRGCVLF